jgi:starch-binding outer membrane protein, SusD/RagB family
MKKFYLQLLVISSVVSLALVSCKKNSFLSATTVSSLNKSTVFVDSAYTNDFLASIYSQIGFDVAGNEFGNGGMDAAGDESQANGINQSDANYWATGTINAAQTTTSVYTTCYNEIRAVNLLLANISQTKLSLPAGEVGSKIELKAEARFLRAWYYAILLKHYGGIVLVGNNVYSYTQNIPSVRSSYAACVNYITSECDSAGLYLPITQTANFYGRASKGACLALKARVLLYAASPLFDDNGTIPGPTPYSTASAAVKPLVGYANAADSAIIRWRMARDAAAAVINTHAFQLWQGNGINGNGFSDLFSQRGYLTQEYILQWMLPATNYSQQLEGCWDPPSRGGSNGAYPYQETVDVFPMLDGKAITDNTSTYTYNPQNPYVNRDPRMNYSIIHDQTVLPIRLQPGYRSPVNIYVTSVNGGAPSGGIDALGTSGATTTGYYTNKMLDTAATSTAIDQLTNRCQPLMRFAEVLLNFAEAENEFEGPTDSVYSALMSIRQRAGIKNVNGYYGLQPGMTQAQMRTAIQLERRLELSYEGFRFWDVRRWKIAPTEENKQFHGMQVLNKVTTDASGNTTSSITTYNEFALQPPHTFDTRMYLWPIPQSEIGKSTQLLQNPGY